MTGDLLTPEEARQESLAFSRFLARGHVKLIPGCPLSRWLQRLDEVPSRPGCNPSILLRVSRRARRPADDSGMVPLTRREARVSRIALSRPLFAQSFNEKLFCFKRTDDGHYSVSSVLTSRCTRWKGLKDLS